MSMLQTPTSSNRDAAAAAAAAAQKKKGLKSSLGRFFSKKEKVNKISLLISSYHWRDFHFAG